MNGLRSAPWHIRLIATLVLIGALVLLMDFLAVTTHQAIGKKDLGWQWGAREAASGALSAPTRPTSLSLLFTVSGDQLTAQLKVAAPAGTDLTGQLLAAQNAESGDDIVDGLLGQVSLAQFHDGITGNQHEWATLRFGPPQLNVTANGVTATFSSSPYRLLVDQQYMYIHPPAAAGNVPDNLQFTGPSGIQLVGVTGARITSTDNGKVGLLRDGSAMSAVLREWKFLLTWSTAVLAAVGAAAATFLSTAATDLGHEASTVIIGQGTPSSATPPKPGP